MNIQRQKYDILYTGVLHCNWALCKHVMNRTMTTEYVPTDKMGNIVSKCIYYSNWNSFAFSVWYVVVL